MERSGESDLSYDKCKMKIHFPLSEDNTYGIIPLVGFASSCFTAGILMELLSDGLRYMAWSGVWFYLGFFIFATLQLSYGFHAKHEEFLMLWIVFKAIEIVANIAVLISILSGPHASGILATSIINLIILIVLIYIGYRKYRHLKMNKEDILENYGTLESKVNI